MALRRLGGVRLLAFAVCVVAVLAVAQAGSSSVPPFYACSGPEITIFDNTNANSVGNGGASPQFPTGGAFCVDSIFTYHWNDGIGDAGPGSVNLFPVDAIGGQGGPWPVTVRPATGNVPANWVATPSPGPVVIDGLYRCDDSNPTTWSQNGASNGNGFCKVVGRRATFDNTPPSLVLTGPSDGSSLHGPITFTADASDAGTGMTRVDYQTAQVGSVDWTTRATATSAPFSANWTPASSDDGTLAVRAVAYDVADNSTATDPITVTLDNTPPTLSLGCNAQAGSCGGWFTATPVQIYYNTSDANGVTGPPVYTTGGGDPFVTGQSWSDGPMLTQTTTLRVGVEDTFGNRTIVTQTVQIDTSAPSVPQVALGPSSVNAYLVGTRTGRLIWYRPSIGSAELVVPASDDLESGVASVDFPLEGLPAGWTVSAPGPRTATYSWNSDSAAGPTFSVRSTNGAGSVGDPSVISFRPDTAAPTGTVVCVPVSCTNSAGPVTLTLQGQDADSGVGQIRYTTDGSAPSATTGTVGNAVTVTAPSTTVTFWAVDNVGNEAVVATQRVAQASPAQASGWLVFQSTRPATAGSAFGVWKAGLASPSLAQLSSTSIVARRPDASRDGTQIVWEQGPDNGSQLVLTDVGGKPIRTLTSGFDDHAPAFSPDGTKVAFSRHLGAPTSAIIVLDLATGGSTNITGVVGGVKNEDPTWSADGTRIAYDRATGGGQADIVVQDAAAGAAVTTLTTNAGLDVDPAWSPDGTQIAFDTVRGNTWPQIAVMNADGTNQHLVTTSYSGFNDAGDQNSDPAWSPDSTRIAFVFSPGGAQNFDVLTMNADGTSRTKVTDDPGASPAYDGYPTWLAPAAPASNPCGLLGNCGFDDSGGVMAAQNNNCNPANTARIAIGNWLPFYGCNNTTPPSLIDGPQHSLPNSGDVVSGTWVNGGNNAMFLQDLPASFDPNQGFELTTWVNLAAGYTQADLLFDWDRCCGATTGSAGFTVNNDGITFSAWGQSKSFSPGISMNSWHQLKLRADAGTYTSKLFVDGVQLGSIAVTGTPYTFTPRFVGPQSTLTLGDLCGANTCTFPNHAYFDDVSLVQLQAPVDASQNGPTFTVNTAADHSDDAGCTQADCTLREALEAANAQEGPNTVAFKIGGGGVHTITPGSPLPAITDPATIDGYTQPSASANTLAIGDNASPKIEVHGTGAAADGAGIDIQASNTTVRGLVVNGGFLYGIAARGSASNDVIAGNFIGTDPTGTSSQSPDIYGVIVRDGVTGVRIGGPAPADRNVISGVVGGQGNNGAGIAIGTQASNNTVQGNYVGTDPSGTRAVPNQIGIAFTSTTTSNTIQGNLVSGNNGDGLYMQQAGGDGATRNNTVSGNTIGVASDGLKPLRNGGSGISVQPGVIGTHITNNEIANSGGTGITILASLSQSSTANTILGNKIHDNSGLGIDLGGDGITANDNGDSDVGANNLQNFPAITAADSTHIAGTLTSTANADYTVELFSSDTCDASGNGEGATSLGSFLVHVGDGGGGTWSIETGAPAGVALTATATSVTTGDTSEFSACFRTVASVSSAVLTVDQSTTNVGASSFAIDSLPPELFQQLTGAIGAAPIPSAPIPSAAVGAAPIPSAPIPSAPIPSAPIPSAPIADAPIPSAPIPSAPIASAGLGGLPIASADLSNPLDAILLSSLPSLDVNALFVGTNLAGRLPQQYTLGDIYRAKSTADSITLLALQRFNALKQTQLPLSQTMLRGVRTLSYLLGGKTLNKITLPGGQSWADALAANGGSALNVDVAQTTVIGLDIMRQLGTLDLGHLTVGNLTNGLDGTLAGEAYLARIALLRTTLASVRLSTLSAANTIVDCARISCVGTLTLGDAAKLSPSAIRDQVALKSLGTAANGLTLNELVVALTPRNAFPWEQESIVGWQGFNGQAEKLQYHLDFDARCPVTSLKMSAKLPYGFLYVPGSTTYQVGGGAPVAAADPSQTSETGATWTNIAPPACAAGAAQHIRLNFKGEPGFQLGVSSATASVKASGGTTIVTGAPVLVQRNWANALDRATAPTLGKDSIVVSHVAEAGQVNYFRFPEHGRGKVVTIYLRPPNGVDLDLYVVRPAVASLLASPIASAPIPSAPIPSAPIPSAPIASADTSVTNTSDNPPPELLDDGPLPGGAVAVNSITRGDGVEVVSFRQGGGTGFDEIAVAGYNGASSDQPFTLRIQEEDPAPLPALCPARTFANGAPAQAGAPTLGPLPSTTQALALVNVGRMNAMYGAAATTTMLDKLKLVMASVSGQVLQVDADNGVFAASQAWDQSPCSIDAANNYVKAINAYVAKYRANLTNLQSITIVGNDEQIAMARIADFVPTSNEFDNTGTLSFLTANGNDNATFAAAGLGYVLTDDAYGAFHTRTLFGHEFFLPEVALGRLVETPAEIQAQLQAYLDSSTGTLDGSSGLVTGYDFMADGAKAVDDGLAQRIGAVALGKNKLLTSGWGKAALEPFFTGAAVPAKVNSWNAHYDYHRLMPAVFNDATDLLSTASIANPLTPRFNGNIFFTMGCHTGQSLPDTLTDATKGLDWAQAYARNGAAVFVGNTGYGYGDTASVALSERLMAMFGTHLGFSGSIGEKFMTTKNEYFAQMGAFGPFDEKALTEATFYGLPFWKLNSPPEPTPTPPGPVTPDGTTGLSVAPLTIAPTLVRVDDSRGTFWKGAAGVVFVQGRSVQPLETQEISQPAASHLVAHGFFPNALATHDVTDLNMYFAKPMIDLAAHELEPSITNDTFPANMIKVAQSDYLGRRHSTLDLITGQSRPGSAPSLQDERLIDSVSGQITYAADTVTDYTAPRFRQTGSIVSGGSATIFATVSDESSGGVIRVRAFYTSGGAWSFVDLAPVSGVPNAWRATTPVAATKIEVGFVAEDAAANTAWMTDKGHLVTSFSSPPSAPITISSPLDGAVYGAGQSVPASYSCTGLAGVASCSGTVANGAAVDTSGTGAKTFTVTVTPLVGPPTTKTIHYWVGDLILTASVTPNAGTTGSLVIAAASFKNTAAVARDVTFSAAFGFGTAFVFETPSITVRIPAGAKAAGAIPFRIPASMPRGTYTVLLRASDVSGTVTATATLTVR